MRFMLIVKASAESEAGVMPEDKLIAEMTKFNEEMQKAGVLLDLSGLQPSSNGARVKFTGGKRTLVEGQGTEALLPDRAGVVERGREVESLRAHACDDLSRRRIADHRRIGVVGRRPPLPLDIARQDVGHHSLHS